MSSRGTCDQRLNWSAGDADPVTVTVPSKEDLLADVADRLDRRAGFSVATLNLDHVVKLRCDPAFRQAYAAHSHVTADGNPIVWLSQLAGQRGVRLAPGSELIAPISALAAQKAVPVALFGATEASLAQAATALQERYPGLDVVLTLAPPMGFDPAGTAADKAIERLAASGARLVFLALGAPKQEIFAARAQGQLPETGFLSIGAGLDFISGAQVRAPVFVRRLAAEWLWRLVQNPRRLWRRYWGCLMALPALALRALSTRLRRQAS